MTIDLTNEAEILEAMHISQLDDEEVGEGGESPSGDVEDNVSTSTEEDDDDRVPMTLGFVEKPKNEWSLLRQYFPSKAGGSPAWLDPVNLPSGKSSLCDFCGEPLQFLLQVYAPLTEESTFHRVLFIFMCPSSACLVRDCEQLKQAPDAPQRSVKVFRCQLPRVNSFYSSESPANNGSAQPLTAGALLCNWCGTWKGDKFCGSCNRARYCSAMHQTAHWKSSMSSHKVYCRKLDETSGKLYESAACNTLWPEYEITNEDEDDYELSDAEMPNDNGLVPGDQVDDSIKQDKEYFNADFVPSEAKYFKGWGDVDTKSLAAFQERISLAPEQVLRYSSSAQAKPMWPLSGCRPSELDIRKCNYCGCRRRFEFQVLPQLLYFFHDDSEDSLDWSTIAAYTCEASCGENAGGYKEEFAWVQPASQSHQ